MRIMILALALEAKAVLILMMLAGKFFVILSAVGMPIGTVKFIQSATIGLFVVFGINLQPSKIFMKKTKTTCSVLTDIGGNFFVSGELLRTARLVFLKKFTALIYCSAGGLFMGTAISR